MYSYFYYYHTALQKHTYTVTNRIDTIEKMERLLKTRHATHVVATFPFIYCLIKDMKLTIVANWLRYKCENLVSENYSVR